ncbi:hypothetical protein OS493_017538, partial [Desmophyllum pertusum]
YYAKLKKMEEEREQELADKYRDRARERRDGLNPDYQSTDSLSATANYRAVGPTAEASNTAAERRRQAIQESKFLGGDMEHTHLVKGLDFALLQKVRSEIAEEDEEDEELHVKKMKSKQKDKEEDDNAADEIEFTTKLGQKIYKTLFRNRPAERNELFQPGRMAYVFDVEDEYAESDIPTTLMRSKADCPGIETQATLTTNDIVINKLTQILLYLRQGTRGGKKVKKKDKGKDKERMINKPDKRCVLLGLMTVSLEKLGIMIPLQIQKNMKRKKRQEKERERNPRIPQATLRNRQAERMRHSSVRKMYQLKSLLSLFHKPTAKRKWSRELHGTQLTQNERKRIDTLAKGKMSITFQTAIQNVIQVL